MLTLTIAISIVMFLGALYTQILSFLHVSGLSLGSTIFMPIAFKVASALVIEGFYHIAINLSVASHSCELRTNVGA